MSSADDDIFDEPDPRHDAPRRSGRGGGARPPGRGAGGASPLSQPGVRALIGIGLLVVVALILISSIRGCQRDKLVDSYKTYLGGANALATESGGFGKTLQTTLANKTFQRKAQIIAQVDDLALKSKALVERAKALKPPDRLKAPHQTLVTALEYRALGLSQLPAAIDQATATVSKDANAARTSVATPLQVLAASDVIFRTSFVGPAQEAIQADNIKDVPAVATSEFFPGDTWERSSLAGAATIINSIRQVRSSTGDDPTASGSGKHGLSLDSTFAVRGTERKQLLPGNTVSLAASAEWKFDVVVENSGDFTEAGVDVKVTYITPDNQAGTTETQQIASIEPGESANVTLTFPLPGGQPYLTGPSTVKVEVVPVADEQVSSNNSAQYPVEFSLSS